jgi:histone H3/H4
MADDVGLPKSTLQKSIKDLVPKDMRIASEASDLLVQCCNQFVHLLSTQANDISEREKRSTITPEHVVKALEELEFGEQYIEAVKAGKQAMEQLTYAWLCLFICMRPAVIQ